MLHIYYLKKEKIILIDLDLRKPKVHRIYDVENSNGVTDVLADRVTLNDAIKRDENLGFDVLTSGEKTTAVINLIESEKMNKLITSLKDSYDYILLDSPPVINVSDALYISKLSDAIIFIISQNETKRGLVKEAMGLLNKITLMYWVPW